uniref:C2H2-type domain-containing protein n=1 Tax=Romanomermis culicivorax TaxID=13658 RepID=A0A915KLR4_ROMCU
MIYIRIGRLRLKKFCRRSVLLREMRAGRSFTNPARIPSREYGKNGWERDPVHTPTQLNQQAREEGRKYPCPHCGKRFKTKSSRDEHCSYVHSRKFRSVDDSDTSDSVNFTFHRPFVCKECTKSFSLKKDLNRHTRVTHSDARPFQCHCGKAYKTKYHLTRHVSATNHILLSS